MRILARIVVVAFSLMTISSCGDTFIGGTTVNVNQQQGGNPSPGPSGNPTGGLIATVKIGEVGEACASGFKPAEEQNRQIAVKCKSFITCSPKGADGKDVPIAVSGANPDSFSVIAGSQNVNFVPWDDNGFNADVAGLSAGPFTLECVVKGVTSGPVGWQVVAAIPASAGEPVRYDVLREVLGSHADRFFEDLKLEDFGPIEHK